MAEHPSSSLAISWVFMATVLCCSMIIFVGCGFIAGRISTIDHGILTIIPDSNRSIATVSLHGIRNGVMEGTASGAVRLSADGTMVDIEENGSFTISDVRVLTNTIEITIPEGMHFVASSRGKKYYPVTSKSGQNLSPANRIYFPDEKSAKAAGYTP